MDIKMFKVTSDDYPECMTMVLVFANDAKEALEKAIKWQDTAEERGEYRGMGLFGAGSSVEELSAIDTDVVRLF